MPLSQGALHGRRLHFTLPPLAAAQERPRFASAARWGGIRAGFAKPRLPAAPPRRVADQAVTRRPRGTRVTPPSMLRVLKRCRYRGRMIFEIT